MIVKKSEYTAQSTALATSIAKSRIEATLKLAKAFETDPMAAERREKCQCSACFYPGKLNGRIAGAAMTSRKCACCDTEVVYGSTYTQALCQPCAQANELCRSCGGDIEMRTRLQLG